ncbi:ornithine cyclodeaminase family protein [Rhodoligotrophos ferricapiens]|uniref:ornithine cyclodeaminase family protein n=1 Tax=Rhodoligotrophos ferricapiens TaxID=3069264 RepID=UPI00315D6B8B
MQQRPGAARIGKGSLPVLILSEAEVERLIEPRALLDTLADGFRAMSQGRVQAPARQQLTVPSKGFSLAMPAWMEGFNLTVKIVNVFEDNLAVGLPNHLALIALFDPQTGAPLALLDGTYITAVRTAASAILSVEALARRDARIATVVGAGIQGREHLRLLPLARDFAEIRIASLYPEDAEALAREFPGVQPILDLEAAIRSSDVVCLASHAYEPVISADWVRPGAHVTSVGYAPPRGELPPDLLDRATLYVETEAAFEPPPVGCAELANLSPSDGIRLGDMLAGSAPGRISDQQVTVYKAMGIAMEDMVAAHLAYRSALRERVGRQVVL